MKAFLTSQLLTAQGRVWIGLQKFRGQKRFLWISNEDVTYTNWAPGEPNGDKRLVIVETVIIHAQYVNHKTTYHTINRSLRKEVYWPN